MEITRFDQLDVSPWKNGGGVTREISRHEADGKLLWRLSIADVGAEGPFSPFPRLERLLTVIEGGGMTLELEGNTPLAAKLFEPVRFSGNEAINGLLPNGPCRDFNVIWDPERVAASIDVFRGRSISVAAEAGAVTGVLCVDGMVRDRQGQSLNRFDFAILGDGETVDLDGEGTVLIIHIRPVSQ